MRLYHNGKGVWYGTQREARDANQTMFRQRNPQASWFECSNGHLQEAIRKHRKLADLRWETWPEKAALLKYLNKNEVTP
tara:strand:- start:1496 stop:1732 length:237 start_codon:yes stop_codon:yes gene_type:complete